MEKDVKKRFMKGFMHFRKMHMDFQSTRSLQSTELFAMLKMIDHEEGITSAQLQEELRINKSAVSQMLTSLEQKGYIARNVNELDRRRIDILLTAEGKQEMQAMWEKMDEAITEIISRFGEDKTHLLIDMMEELKVIFDEVQAEILTESERIQ